MPQDDAPAVPEPGNVLGSGAVRCTDLDRYEATTRLKEAFADGALKEDELTQRVALAFQAVSDRDLRRLTSDLKSPERQPRPPKRSLTIQRAVWTIVPAPALSVPVFLIWLGKTMGGFSATHWTPGAAVASAGVITCLLWFSVLFLSVHRARQAKADQNTWRYMDKYHGRR